MLQAGDHIADRFEIESLLGEGGLAQVYRVRHLGLGTAHAFKLLTLTHPSLVERLLQEGRIQAQLRHPNIVAVTDIVMHRGQPGLLMEFVEGETLEAALLRDGPPPLEDALDLFAQVLGGVASAHAAGVLHRDLKPANILLSRGQDGVTPKVTDFGIAKVARGGSEGTPLTRLGVTMGTPGYMAPEQSEDASTVDQRADVFALGAILYELVTGQRAFPSSGVRETLNATANALYVPPSQMKPDLPPAVCAAIRTALAPRPEDRFPDCVAFGVALFEGQPQHLARLTPGRGAPPPLPAFLWPRPTPVTPTPSTMALSLGGETGKPSGTLDEKVVAEVGVGTLVGGGAAKSWIKGWMVAGAGGLLLLGMLGSLLILSRLLPLHQAGGKPLATTAETSAPPPAPVISAAPDASPAEQVGAPSSVEAPPPPAAPTATPADAARPVAKASAPAVSAATPKGPAQRVSAAPASQPPTSSTPAASSSTAEPPVPVSETGGTEPVAETPSTGVPDLSGPWVGDPWNLTILRQDGARVSGFIFKGSTGGRISVSGAYNPETRTLVVRDASASRYVLTATVHGDRLTGTYTQGEGELSSRWSARRSR